MPLLVWKQILQSLKLIYNYYVWEALPVTFVNQRLLFKISAAHRPEEARNIHIVLRNGHLRVVNFFCTIFPCDSDKIIPWEDQVGRQVAQNRTVQTAAKSLYRPFVKRDPPDVANVDPNSLKHAPAQPSVHVAAAVHNPTPAAASSSSAAPVAATSQAPVNSHFKDIPNSNMRKVIAKRLTESKATVPHFYTSIECKIDSLMALRKTFKKDMELNISVNDLVIKSAALALRDVPEANSRWNKQSGSIDAATSKQVDISVAVATPNGLITPILTGADKRGLVDINSTVKDLATRARDGKLKPEEYQGGSFSISNLGMYGITSFSAVINPPQACILAVGAGIQKMLPPKANSTTNRPRVVTTVTVQLSADRRVIDEATAAQYLQVFQSYLSNPHTIML
eukprot:gene18211-20738_t